MRVGITTSIIFISIVLVPTSIAAFASRWVLASESENTKAYVDVESIVRSGANIRYWVKSDYQPPTKRGWKQDITLMEADCAAGRKRNLQITVYFIDGTTDSTSTPGQWRYPVPGTVGEGEFEFACLMSKY